MSLWSRIANVFRGDLVNREIEEEFELHIAEAVAEGRDPVEARRAFGSVARQREESRDVRITAWLDSLRADTVFGWRMLWKKKVTSVAAVLSLGLAIGACTSAFRFIDALLLRPLPVAHPEQLYEVARQGFDFGGAYVTVENWAYPDFELMRAAAKGQAELFAISYAAPVDLTYRSDEELEKATLQYVSGSMFPSFGLRPVLGRLLTGDDDVKPGGHPYAVLSYDYWSRRFGRDAQAVGRKFRMGDNLYEIVGVGPERFTGTETGTLTDVFVPTMMNPAAIRDDNTWHRTLARVHPGVALEPLRARLDATSRAFETARAKGFTGMTKESIDKLLAIQVVVQPAAAGASELQRTYRRSLAACGVLVALVLLIACANVANLMTAQAAARAREMALRVSIGAGRWRLVQLVLVESAWVAFLSAGVGALFAWWAAPFVVSRINPADNPAHLELPADWRVLGFGLALTLVVTLLFGLAPALRASGIKPASALKGGSDPHSRRRLMHVLISVQATFCFLVLFVGALFVVTFDHLSHRPMGFSAERILTLETTARQPEPPVQWDQLAERLRGVPGVETVAIAGWPLLGGGGWNGFVSVNGAPPGPVVAYFLSVSPVWRETMKIALINGRDLGPDDTSPGEAIVNETFARQYFEGRNPLGQMFAKGQARYRVVGLVKDAPYRSLREPILPVAYVPFHGVNAARAPQLVRAGTFIVRTSGPNPSAMAQVLRKAVSQARAGFRVNNVRTQRELVDAQTVRERLLAMLALFFAAVAVLLAGVGMYGVLDYSVLQRRREIGIRRAVGAKASHITRDVTAGVFSMVLAGGVAGAALGLASVRYLESLLYGVTGKESAALAFPAMVIAAAAIVAAVPAVVRALGIDPAKMLRAE
jgi:predicted permease